MIRDSEPCCINLCMFIFCTLILLAEFYKCYINCNSIEQSYRIRKLVSTRYDLNMQQYQYFIPSINVPNQQFAFGPESYNYINNDYNLKKPTKAELKAAQQYKNKIPQYQCNSYSCINGKIKVGVVKDNPAYCSSNFMEGPPPNCKDPNNDKEGVTQDNNENSNYAMG